MEIEIIDMTGKVILERNSKHIPRKGDVISLQDVKHYTVNRVVFDYYFELEKVRIYVREEI